MKNVKTMEMDGKKYILLDSIHDVKGIYCYFSNISDAYDIRILKDEGDSLVGLENETEFDYALTLFFHKHKNDQMDETTSDVTA